MLNFHSKALDRTFESIWFVQTVSLSGQGNSHQAAAQGHAPIPAGTPRDAAIAAPAPGEIEKLEGGKAIEEIISDRAALKGQTISLRAKVIKVSENIMGSEVDTADPQSIHMLLCEGVGEFKIQGWNDALQQWLPEVDPDGDGYLEDTHFYVPDSNNVPGVLYPYPPNGVVAINNIDYPREQVDEAHFGAIPGLGRAFKFTFTLFDSKGIIKEGRTFTHIVYLDD